MEHEIVNKYSEASVLTKPVHEAVFKVRELIALLNDGVNEIFPKNTHKIDHAHVLVAINLFERFLAALNPEEIKIHEDLLENFRDSFKHHLLKRNGEAYSQKQERTAVDSIRHLINHFFLPKGIVYRKLLRRKVYLKYKRFLSLSKATQELFIAYEKDARKLKVTKKYFDDPEKGEQFRYFINRKIDQLSTSNRQANIRFSFTLLEMLGKSSIEEIEKSDLERFIEIYRSRNKLDAAQNCLKAFFSIVCNGVALGLLKRNPFDNLHLERKKLKSKQDFVMPDQISKLLNLETLNWNNPKELRDRCITMLLYDTGLRASAATKLRMEDFHELPDGRYKLVAKGKYLKGEKNDKTLYILFQETIPLLRHWLKVIRPPMGFSDDHVFVSLRSKPLTLSGIGNIVREYCRKLEISTFKGRVPSPHTLRHTLATLNTEPYGKCVAPRLMQERLGHMNFSTFERIYVHNNPLSEMKEYEKLFIRGIDQHPLEKISREDFWKLLDSLAAAKSASIVDIKRAYEQEIEQRKRSKQEHKLNDFLKEAEAIHLMASFKIDYRSLRQWAAREGVCQTIKEKGKYRYNYHKNRIADLAENYMTSEAALKKFSGSRSDFYRRSKKCQKVIIGKKTLISKHDFLRFFLDDLGKSKAPYLKIRMDTAA